MSSYELDWKGAEREFHLAIKLNPYYAPAYYFYANLLTKVGQMDRALVEIQKAYVLDPVSLSTNLTMGKLYYFARRYDEAINKGREVLETHPQFGVANGLIGLAYLEIGRIKEALKEFQVMLRSLARDAKRENRKSNLTNAAQETLGWMGYAYAMQDKRARALEVLDQLEGLAQHKYVEAVHLAIVHIGLGNNDQAFDLLDKAFEQRCATLTYIKVWPMLDRVRNHPRYHQLIRRLGLETL